MILLISINPSYSRKREKISLRDTTDNHFDLSEYLQKATGIFPVPIVITEPAVGYGGGAALLYFHKRENRGEIHSPIKTANSPSISFVSGFYTESKTWLGALGHFGLWKGDRIRYLGAVGYLDANLSIYIDPILIENLNIELPFTTDNFVLIQELQFRINESNFFLGGRYTFFTSSTSVETPILNRTIEKDSKESGITFLSTYDNRDNIFTPTKGVIALNQTAFYAQFLGGDNDYIHSKTEARGYYPFTSRFMGALRLNLTLASDNTPFYLVPSINMRGIPMMRYQGNRVALSETELTFGITPRWFILGFGGVAQAGKTFDEFTESSIKYNYGTGFRYHIARELGINMGMDFAWGPDDWAFYFQFGSAWF